MSSEDDYITGECVKCSGSISFPAYAVGMSVECPHCSQETILTAPAAPAMAPTPAPPPPPPPPPPAPAPAAPKPSPPAADNPFAPASQKKFSPGMKSKHRYSAQGMTKPINFFCTAPDAKAVSVIGGFNNWDPTANPMMRQPDGNWFVSIELNHGHHAYMLQVDDRTILDPRATGITRNEKGERVSLCGVS